MRVLKAASQALKAMPLDVAIAAPVSPALPCPQRPRKHISCIRLQQIQGDSGGVYSRFIKRKDQNHGKVIRVHCMFYHNLQTFS
jgi:hypothetical protein